MGLKVKDAILSNEGIIDLSRFPPNLRKLGKYLLKHGMKGTLKATCEELKLNVNSITSQIYSEKQKGNDFNKFIEEISFTALDTALIDVDRALINGAVSDSHADRKLFYQRTGRLKDNETNVNINVLSVSAPVNTTPPDVNQDKGIIDAEVLLPDDKD